MAKFYGIIGYAETIETEPGIYKERITERYACGDLVRNVRNLQTSASVNDDVTVTNEISIIADPYAEMNFHKMRYIEFMGAKWKIKSAEVLYPRLKLTIGGLYNE